MERESNRPMVILMAGKEQPIREIESMAKSIGRQLDEHGVAVVPEGKIKSLAVIPPDPKTVFFGGVER